MACENGKNSCACAQNAHPKDPAKRDFMMLAATATAGIGAACAAAPFIGSMNPAADVRALASTEADISGIKVGEEKRIMWQGKTVFIKHRTPEEISQAVADDTAEMPDPATDASRTKPGKQEWLIVLGVCTHLGCIPSSHAADHESWLCPCHGSHYDTSGRIRKGPAPKNLVVPPYVFLTDTKIKIG